MRLARCLVLILILNFLTAGTTRAQNANGISSPRDNAVVHGLVLVEGTATHPDFLRYELSFFKEFDPLGDWVVFATGDQPVINGTLATWDTTVGRDAGAPFYLDGTYRLRLRVVRRDSNYDEYFVLGISLDNERATETPTETPGAESVASPLPTLEFAVPTELATLTPFPTGTPRPTAEPEETVLGIEEPSSEQSDSFFSLEGDFSSEQIRNGFCLGGQIALGFFGILAAYYFFRTGLRSLLSRLRGWFFH
jgi:hypothetical protein